MVIFPEAQLSPGNRTIPLRASHGAGALRGRPGGELRSDRLHESWKQGQSGHGEHMKTSSLYDL